MKPFLSDFEQYLQAQWCDHVPGRCDSHTLHFVTKASPKMDRCTEISGLFSHNCMDCLFAFEW